MHIKSMVIDGFKSYGQRTEINGFDPLFNAVTGLNGSGKSNILDSICFLLGITNLSQVRATNLQDLVYKNGQAGITKATVSIAFDNRDKNQSPIGYEQYEEITVTRQVVVGGKNKYLINGLNAQNSRVQDLFRSVQLNVNNPHFLIMQGRITKVLNMKPIEILSMIEEAAGTKLYESKKQNAQKTIEKKDAKLKEINAILDEEITPTLTKLKDERASYLEYQKIHRELEHLSKIYTAYEFVCAQNALKEADDEMKSTEIQIKASEKKIEEAENEIKDIEKTISHLQKKRSEEEHSKLGEYEQQLKIAQSAEVKTNSTVKNNEENIRAEQKKKKELQKNLDEDSIGIKNKQQELEKLKKAMLSVEENEQKDAENLATAQKRFQSVSAGLSSNDDGEEATLADQLIAAKTEIATAETEMKQAQMKVKHATDELKKKKAELKKTESSYKIDQETFHKAEKVLKNVESEMKNLNYEEGQEENLTRQRRTLIHEISEIKDKLDSLQAKFPQLNFDYKNPEKNFDRSKVSGLLCNLFQVKDVQTARALEVVAGGKLYNIVVDSEMTAKKLLQKGELKRRCTFIPLNKISRGIISSEVVRRAEHLVGKENVFPALSLINCSKDLLPAMEFAFGNAFVCPDMNTAKRVAFDSGIQKRTVTLEGEVFDPSGTLSGGARPQGSSILVHANNVKELQQNLETKQRELYHLDGRLEIIQKVSEKFRHLKQQFDLKSHECELLHQKLQQSQHHLQLEEIQNFEKSIDEHEAMVKRCQEIQKKSEKKVKDLELKIKEGKSLRERELKAAENEVAKFKKQAENSNRLLKEKQKEADSIKLELDDLEKAVSNYTSQMAAVETTIQSLQENSVRLKETLASTKQEVSEIQTKLKEQKNLLRAKDQEISDCVNKQQKLNSEINSEKLKIRQLTYDTGKFKSSIKEANQTLEYLIKKHDWIAEDKKYFGQQNTAYDFNANNPVEAGKRIQKLQETKDKMAKNVNMRAMNMLGKAEEQYNDLMTKKKIVENDKEKIATVIRELDEKKNEALTRAWEQVNRDFGSIFSTLLPGTQAKLVPPEGQNVLDGLEVKVAFGNVWKESLGELSGGQRSLVALSLILSMLLFKPAPIYILDEVDAALDLSHTQNIGQMLHSHFKHSQFIVVSLKDGMFNNANVLFKTKFVEGMSTVTRFEQRSAGRR